MSFRTCRRRRAIVAIALSTSVLTMPAGAPAQTSSPLDADAPVASTKYESPLVDFRAFEPDEAMQSWVDANRRVDEIGGWRTYLRQANPPKKRVQRQAEPASQNTETTSTDAKTAQKSDEPVVVRTEIAQQPAPAANSAIPSTKKEEVAALTQASNQPEPSPPEPNVPELAEGGLAQTDTLVLPLPKIPGRFSRGECPRILTGLKLPIGPRRTVLSVNAEKLLLRVVNCFKSRRYVIGGHTDGRGPLSANQKLSQSRADAVRALLIANGVDPQRVTSRGFGESRPIDTNRTKRGRARNRRIDFSLDR